MGKSSTANSVFKERVAKPSVFQDGEPKAAAVSRKAADFVLTVVDTPSLQDAEVVSQAVRFDRAGAAASPGALLMRAPWTDTAVASTAASVYWRMCKLSAASHVLSLSRTRAEAYLQQGTLTVDYHPVLRLRCIHTLQGLDTLLDEAKRHTVDAVIWVDRLDVFRVSSLDRQVRCRRRSFGQSLQLWEQLCQVLHNDA